MAENRLDRRGLEVFQTVEPLEGGYLYRIALGYFGVRREGVAWGKDLLTAKRQALEEAMALWELPEEERSRLRRAMGFPAERAQEEGETKAPTDAPSLEPQPDSAKEDAKEDVDARALLKRLLDTMEKRWGKEIVRKAYALADLPYGELPTEPEEIRRLYQVARSLAVEASGKGAAKR